MQIIKTLKSFGIMAKIQNQHRDLIDNDAFFMTLSDNRKELLLNDKGRVEVLNGDRSFRQVILKVTEEAREIRMNNSGSYFEDRTHAITRFRRVYNVPDSTRFTYNKRSNVLVARAPATTTYFLVGFDERHMFISELPEPVRTVKEAHECLIPKEIRGKSYVRQGEFFLVPLNKAESDKLFRNSKRFDIYSFDDIGESDHTTSILIEDDDSNEYVMGKIGNERHELYLDRLHRVYRNREVVRAGRFFD